MTRIHSLLVLTIVAGIFFQACNMSGGKSQKALNYPETRKDTVVDNYFGTEVADPYRWLEDDRSEETEAWVKAQNEVTFGYLNQIPFRQKIEDRLTELFNYPRLGGIRRAGEWLFFSKNDGLQNQAVIYVQKGLDGDPRVFIDPNQMSEEGTVAVNLVGFSEDHRYAAYSVAAAGSDWQEIRIKEIESGDDLPDVLQWVKFSGANWMGDGFFYSRYPQPEAGKEFSAATENSMVYFHKLGDDQAQDRLVYSDPAHPNHYHSVDLTDDKKYLILYKSTGTDGFETWYKPASDMQAEFRPITRGFKNKSAVVDHVNGDFIIQTDIGAPRYKLVQAPVRNPQPENWSDLVPEADGTLESSQIIGNRLFLNYLEKATNRLRMADLQGQPQGEIALPTTGSAGIFGSSRDYDDLFFYFTSYTYPTTIYRYDIDQGSSEEFFRPEVKFDPEAYETKQVTYESKDGTPVTMFITHQKGLKLDGKRPTYLYGYGGFNVSRTPGFSSSLIPLLENGGVYAVPNLRGGGEYGEEWHQAGMLEKKQNVFDDFIAAAEYLMDQKYTNRERLAIAGGSNGGLLVGACMTQRPDLYAVTFPAVGVMDMLRYHHFTVGWGWIPEYGCADSSETQFKYLYAYSPLHNLKEGTRYPATMVTTADHDDRVVPAHSFKFAATLQEAHAGPEPVLIRIETDAGHGAGKPISKTIEAIADRWAFMFYNMDFQPKF